MKKEFLKYSVIMLNLFISCSGIMTDTKNHEIVINGQKYFIRATIGGIGGTYVYTIGKKKRACWKYDEKKEIHLRTSSLRPCFYTLLNDTLHFFSEERLVVPEPMTSFPMVQRDLSDTALIENPILLHEYSRGW